MTIDPPLRQRIVEGGHGSEGTESIDKRRHALRAVQEELDRELTVETPSSVAADLRLAAALNAGHLAPGGTESTREVGTQRHSNATPEQLLEAEVIAIYW